MSRLQPASSNREHTDYPSTYWHAHYRETSTASFLQECLTGVSWTLLIFFKLGVKNEAGIVEGIGRGFMHHSTVLQTCLSRRCWIPGRCLEDMNWVWSDWRFDGVSWVEGASLVSQGKTLHQTHTHTEATYINTGVAPSVEEGHHVTTGPMSQNSMRWREKRSKHWCELCAFTETAWD